MCRNRVPPRCSLYKYPERVLENLENQWHLSTLMQHFGGNTAREVNRLHDWKGSLWERRYTGIFVTEEPAAQIERLSYLLAQGLKEDLVERVEDWPGIHFGKYLLEGRSLIAPTTRRQGRTG